MESSLRETVHGHAACREWILTSLRLHITHQLQWPRTEPPRSTRTLRCIPSSPTSCPGVLGGGRCISTLFFFFFSFVLFESRRGACLFDLRASSTIYSLCILFRLLLTILLQSAAQSTHARKPVIFCPAYHTQPDSSSVLVDSGVSRTLPPALLLIPPSLRRCGAVSRLRVGCPQIIPIPSISSHIPIIEQRTQLHPWATR